MPAWNGWPPTSRSTRDWNSGDGGGADRPRARGARLSIDPLELPLGALESAAAASNEFDIPADECCFTGCCERGKAFILEQEL